MYIFQGYSVYYDMTYVMESIHFLKDKQRKKESIVKLAHRGAYTTASLVLTYYGMALHLLASGQSNLNGTYGS